MRTAMVCESLRAVMPTHTYNALTCNAGIHLSSGMAVMSTSRLNWTTFEAAGYWAEVLTVARALMSVYEPLKMNYETLGNSLPHLHTHLVPRFTDDPRPGQPFPLSAQQPEAMVPETQLWADANTLRKLLDYCYPTTDVRRMSAS